MTAGSANERLSDRRALDAIGRVLSEAADSSATAREIRELVEMTGRYVQQRQPKEVRDQQGR